VSPGFDVGCKLFDRTRNKEYLSVDKKSGLVVAMDESLSSMIRDTARSGYQYDDKGEGTGTCRHTGSLSYVDGSPRSIVQDTTMTGYWYSRYQRSRCQHPSACKKFDYVEATNGSVRHHLAYNNE
jgi:hypothetical protein